ncbi:MAG: hypothetical protein B7Z55_12230, partial [Planctomycetales bacterium 12-60-4]
ELREVYQKYGSTWRMRRVTHQVLNASNDPEETFEQEWDWHAVNDILVPKAYSYRKLLGNGEVTKFERTIEFLDTQVNVPIDVAEYSVGSLGLAEGDILNDERAKRVKIQSEGNLLPAEEVLPITGHSGASGWDVKWVLAGNALFVMAATLIVAFNRKRTA